MTLASLYGKALLAKLIIAAIMLALGGYNQRVIHKDALRAVNAIHRQHQLQLVVSSSTDSKRSRSSFSTEELSSSETEIMRGPNKLALLLENVRHKIAPRKSHRSQVKRENDNNKSSKVNNQTRDHDDDNNMINPKQGKAFKASDHLMENQSMKNPAVAWSRTISRFDRS